MTVSLRRWLPAVLLLLPGGMPVAASLPPALDGLVATLDGLRREASVPAMALVILVDGQPVLLTGLGQATADTPFRWGSVTKSFTALAALTLVRDGRVTLDAPVAGIIGTDYFTNPWAAGNPVRLVHLLALSAGFADLSRAEWDSNVPLPLATALARFAPERVVRWPPGLQHSYSNVAPALTAAVIERLTGEPFATYLAAHVLVPLGMTGAALTPVPGLPGGFQADGRTEIPYWHMTYPAFGALNASARDMSGFLTALLNDGRVPGAVGLPAGLLDGHFRPTGTLGAEAGLAVGYGMGIYGWVRAGQVFWGHGGDADGYRSRYGVLPGRGRGYALVINTDNPRFLGRLERLVETALIADLPARTPLVPGSAPATGSDLAGLAGTGLAGLAGTYYPSSSRFSRDSAARAEPAEVVTVGERLEFRRGERTVVLTPVGRGGFVRPGDPAVTVVFVRDGERRYLQGELGNFVNPGKGPCADSLAACE